MRNNTSATCKVVQNVSPHVLSSLKRIKDSLEAKTTPLHYKYRYLLISHNHNLFRTIFLFTILYDAVFFHFHRLLIIGTPEEWQSVLLKEN